MSHNNLQAAGPRSPHNLTPVAIPVGRFRPFGRYKLLHVCWSSPTLLSAITKSAWWNLAFTSQMLPQRAAAGGPKAGAAHSWKSSPHADIVFPQFSEITYFQIWHILWKGFAATYYWWAFIPHIHTDSSFYSGLAEHNLLCWKFFGETLRNNTAKNSSSCSRSCSKVPDMIFIHESPQRWCKILGSLNLKTTSTYITGMGQVLNLVKHHKPLWTCLCDRDLHIRSLSLIVGCLQNSSIWQLVRKADGCTTL